MSTRLRNEMIDPASLGRTELETLAQSLYAVHSEIFDGVSFEEFARYVIHSPAERTRIRLSYAENGELAGYVAMHAFRPKLGGEPCTVIRAEAGLRRAFRGNATSGGFILSNLLEIQWEYSGPTFYLGCLVHPSSYTIVANGAASVFPAAGVEIPEELKDLMMHLGDEFHLEMVDPARPLVRKVGWITRDTPAERRYWQAADLPAARFFIEQNPGYVHGHGLLTLVPLDVGSLGKSMLNWAGSRLRKNLRRTVGSLERNVLQRQLDPLSAEDLLSRVEEITGLDLDNIRQGGILGTRFPLAARSVLFRAGERADAMYIVLEGSLFVLDDSDPKSEIVIDQLGPNTIVGEMAMMTGQARSATVRAAVDSLLLKLRKEDLGMLLSAEPRLGMELWKHIHGRVFGRELRYIPELAQLERDEQEAWFARGFAHHLMDGAELECPNDSILVLSMGRISGHDERGWMSLSAPALIRLAGKTTVKARGEAQIFLMPA